MELTGSSLLFQPLPNDHILDASYVSALAKYYMSVFFHLLFTQLYKKCIDIIFPVLQLWKFQYIPNTLILVSNNNLQ